MPIKLNRVYANYHIYFNIFSSKAFIPFCFQSLYALFGKMHVIDFFKVKKKKNNKPIVIIK